jgi:hypothetical protein
MADVIHLGPHERMTPEQALAVAAGEPWEHVIICGFHRDDGGIVVRSSHISREFSLWIAEHLKMHILGQTDAV